MDLTEATPEHEAIFDHLDTLPLRVVVDYAERCERVGATHVADAVRAYLDGLVVELVA
jgi:hypothetical protein